MNKGPGTKGWQPLVPSVTSKLARQPWQLLIFIDGICFTGNWYCSRMLGYNTCNRRTDKVQQYRPFMLNAQRNKHVVITSIWRNNYVFITLCVHRKWNFRGVSPHVVQTCLGPILLIYFIWDNGGDKFTCRSFPWEIIAHPWPNSNNVFANSQETTKCDNS